MSGRDRHCIQGRTLRFTAAFPLSLFSMPQRLARLQRCCPISLGHKDDMEQSSWLPHNRPETPVSNKLLLHWAAEIVGLFVTAAQPSLS